MATVFILPGDLIMLRYRTLLITPALLLCLSFFSGTNADDGKTNYAVVNLKPGDGVSEGESELITDRLRTELFKTGKVNMMERSQMQEILTEQGFQQSGVCTDEACLVEMGQMLGVKIMVIGSLGKLGSMFMVNIRAIDVQTAQVVKVVSVDIKGDIEEVVGHLADIARNITSSESAPPPPPEPVAEQPETTPEPPPPLVTAEETASDADREDNEDVVVKKAYETPEKNHNRSGVGFTFSFFSEATHLVDGEDLDGLAILDPYDGMYFLISESTYDRYTTPIIDFLVRFYIRAGEYFNIEIGPHFLFGTETYTTLEDQSLVYDAELFIGYYIPGVHLGLDFVKRFHPLKINAGIFTNISVPLIFYSYDYYSYSSGDSFYEESFSPAFRFIPGFRTGAEILLGEHFGFSADFIFQFLQFGLDYDFDELDMDLYDYEETEESQEIIFPKAGISISANIYF
jgi:hypothetical protein